MSATLSREIENADLDGTRRPGHACPREASCDPADGPGRRHVPPRHVSSIVHLAPKGSQSTPTRPKGDPSLAIDAASAKKEKAAAKYKGL